MMTFVGPSVSPVAAGFLQLKENWRWSIYMLIWLAFGTMILMFTLPETLPSQVLVNKARRIRKAKIPGYENIKAPVEATDRTLKGIFKVALVRPWIILFDTISFLVAIYLSVVYVLLYMLFTIYPIVFQQKRHWNSGVGELPLVGTVVGACIGGAYVFYNSAQEKKKMIAGIKREPEDRLSIAMVGGIIFPITMFWFAWTAEFNSIHWIVPTIAGTFLGTAILLLFVGFLNYLTDSYLMFAASALAANTVCRSACGAAAPLFTEYMFNALGVGGGGSLIGGVAVLLAPIPFVFAKYGKGIRKRSKFAPTSKPVDVENQNEFDETKPAEAERHASTASSSSESAERALDEEAGVPDPKELEHDIEKEKLSHSESAGSNRAGGKDRYLDPNGVEKAE